jgi:hypothetical protein
MYGVGALMRLPEFMCIGAQKAGTTWLYAMLKQHPDVWVPPIKEVHFFDKLSNNNRDLSRYQVLAKKRMELAGEVDLGSDLVGYFEKLSQFNEVSLAWYQQVFSWPIRAGVKAGDFTPAYLEIPESSIRNAREVLGDIKIIVIVRRPLERELSQLRMAASGLGGRRPMPGDAEEWMQLYRKMARKRARGAYSSAIPLWKSHFSESNVLAIPFGGIREYPLEFMEQIEDFLQISHFNSYEKLGKRVHKTKKAEIPQIVIDEAIARVADEDAFLKQHFGEDFYERTK